MRSWPLALAAVSGLVAAAACATTSSDGGATPSSICSQVIEELAVADFRCGADADLPTLTAQRTAAITDGSCNDIVAIRDPGSIQTCIDSIKSIDCLSLADGSLDPSCKLQLQRAK